MINTRVGSQPAPRLLGRFKPPDLAERVTQIDFAGFISADRHTRNIEGFAFNDRTSDGTIGDDLLGLLVVLQAPDFSGNIVGIHVVANEIRQPLTAIDNTTRDRLAIG